MKKPVTFPTGLISFPGKTFLIGEYAVLEGAQAVLLNTAPRFEFSVVPKGAGKTKAKEYGFCRGFLEKNLEGVISKKSGPKPYEKSQKERGLSYLSHPVFHPQSPAGQWLKRNPEIAEAYRVYCRDPYLGKGGFGFSSAQFNLVYLLGRFLNDRQLKKKSPGQRRKTQRFAEESKQPRQNTNPPPKDFFSEEELLRLWKAYRSVSFPGLKPSGADVVSQWMGQVCVFSSSPFKARSVKWPFADLDFFLIRVGESFDTHKHLSRLSGESFSGLFPLVEKAVSCFETADSAGFVSAVEKYSAGLAQKGLTTKSALQFLNRLKKAKPVVTAKACGAMGAESAVVFFEPQDKEAVRVILNKGTVTAHSSDLSCGLKLIKKPVEEA